MSIRLAAYVFDGTYAAEDALRKVRAAEELDLVWIDDVAVIKRHKSGRVSVHSTWAQDDNTVKGGIGWGALTGTLLGALAGPGGALAGLFLGGAGGALFGGAADLSVSDPKLDALASRLQKGTSALVLLGETSAFVDAFDELGGELLETAIAEETVEKIIEAAGARKA